MALGLTCVLFPSILDLGNYIVFKKNEANVAYRNIIKTIGSISASALRGLLELAFLPNKAYETLDATIRSIYRLKISKQNLLEWTTSEDAEKSAGTSFFSYYRCMVANVILGSFCVILGLVFSKFITFLLGLAWIIAPSIACTISKENNQKEHLSKEDENYLRKIGKKTWDYFKDNINEKNNFLPPDNYQEDRKEKVAFRTSPTNIGLRSTFCCICI